MLKGIIFDMDGVLIDSTESNFEAFGKFIHNYGGTLKPENRNKYLGKSLADQLKLWKEDFPGIPQNMTVQQLSKIIGEYQAEFEEKLTTNIIVLELIKKAKNRGIKIGVGTSSTRKRAERLLMKIGLLDELNTLITAEETSKHKPNPEVFLNVANELQIESHNCLVIEDAVNGIQAANSAGMKSVARLTSFHTIDDFQDADYVFEDFSNLSLENLESLFK